KARAAGFEHLIGALVRDDRGAGRWRLEMARAARIVVKALGGGMHQRPPAMASISRSSERGCCAGLPLADCVRVSGFAGVDLPVAGAMATGAASAVAISWIFGSAGCGVAAATGVGVSTTISPEPGGTAATGVPGPASAGAVGTGTGTGAGAAAITGSAGSGT